MNICHHQVILPMHQAKKTHHKCCSPAARKSKLSHHKLLTEEPPPRLGLGGFSQGILNALHYHCKGRTQLRLLSPAHLQKQLEATRALGIHNGPQTVVGDGSCNLRSVFMPLVMRCEWHPSLLSASQKQPCCEKDGCQRCVRICIESVQP